MSDSQQPKKDWPPGEGEHGRDEMQDALMGRAQEVEHVQSRFSTLQGPGDSKGTPAGGSPKTAGGTVSVHQRPQERVSAFLPSTEGGAWSVASALRLGAAGFGLMTVVLFVLPELTRTFHAPVLEAGGKVPTVTTYKTIAPVLDKPAPAANPEEVFTEQTAEFDGAAILVVEAEPGNASVRVDGNDQGNTPVSLTLDCLPGKPIKVEVARKGYERAQTTTFCRTNTMIKLYARLRKPEKAPASPK